MYLAASLHIKFLHRGVDFRSNGGLRQREKNGIALDRVLDGFLFDGDDFYSDVGLLVGRFFRATEGKYQDAEGCGEQNCPRGRKKSGEGPARTFVPTSQVGNEAV